MIAAAVAAFLDGWPGPWTEDDLFGTHDSEAVGEAFARFCLAELDSAVAGTLFYESSVGCVAGVVLEDGRRVAVKAHSRTSTPAFLRATARIQTTLVARGFPAPPLLLGPRPLSRTFATVEELVDEGDYRDAHEPQIRAALAEALAKLVSLATDLRSAGLDREREAPVCDGLWPRPHHRMFDFEETRDGTQWIDELAARAKDRLASSGEPVIGHTDWTVKQCRFVGDELRVVYDWDSLGLMGEAELVGHAAAHFTTTWQLEVPLIPSPDEARAFVAEYERARERDFDREERMRLGAQAVYSLAYGARCEACSEPSATTFPSGSQRDGLARWGEEYFRL